MALFYGEATPFGIILLSLTLRRTSLSEMKGFFRCIRIRTTHSFNSTSSLKQHLIIFLLCSYYNPKFT